MSLQNDTRVWMRNNNMYVTDTSDEGLNRQNGRARSPHSADADRISGNAQGFPAQGFPLLGFLKALLRLKLWILLGALLGGGIAAFIALNITPRYHSTAQILIDPRDLRVLQNEVTPGGIVNDSTTAYLESQARVINSDKIKLRVIESESLAHDPEFGGEPERGTPLQEFVKELTGSSRGARRGDPVVIALEEMDRHVYVKRGERTFVIDVTVTSKDPNKAARIANALVQAYFKDQGEVRSEATRRTSTALTGRLAELRDRLRDSEEKVQRFKESNDIASISGRPVSEEQLNQGGALLGQARVRTAEAKAKYDQIRAVRPNMVESGSMPEAMTSGAIIALRAQLGAALGRQADLVTQLGPSHPQMIASRSQVHDARRQIADELERIVKAARVEYERAQAAERSITQRFSDLKKDNFQNSQVSVQLRELEREAEAHRSVYQAFLLRARESSELVGVDTSNARVISDASPPTRNNNVPRKLIVLAGLAAGAGLGLLVGLLQGWGRTQIRAERAAASVSLGQQPAAPGKTRDTPRGFSRIVDPVRRTDPENNAADTEALATTLARTNADDAPAARPSWRRASQTTKPASLDELAKAASMPVLARLPKANSRGWMQRKPELRSVFQDKGLIVDALERPESPFAKAVDDIRNALAPSGPGQSRRIMVLSLTPQSGASMLALNLVLAAAREGDVPLLVDLGRGAKTLTDMLAPDAGLGLDDVYDGSVGFVRAALQDEETGAFFLPREKGRMLYPDEFDAGKLEKNMLSSLRRFSPVVFDGAAIGTDPLLLTLAELADDVLVIGRAEDVTASALSMARRELGEAAGRIRGLVINEG